MAKLPGINYSASSVPSMGRQDPMRPVRTARAEIGALQVLGNVAASIANNIYNTNAEAEYTRGWNEYQKTMSEQELLLANNPYTIDEQTQQVMPNYDSIVQAHSESEKAIRENILGTVKNPTARERLTLAMDERQIEASIGAARIGMDWMVEEARRVGTEAIDEAIDNGDFQSAEETYRRFVNAWTPDERAAIPKYINGQKNYATIRDRLNPDTLEGYDEIGEIRAILEDPDHPALKDVSNGQISELKVMVDNFTRDGLGGAMHYVLQAGGPAAGEQLFQQINQSDLATFGFTNESQRQSVLNYLEGVIQNYHFAAGRSKSEIEEDMRLQEILETGLMDPNETGEKYRNDLKIYDNRIYLPSVEGLEPLSEEWANVVSGLTDAFGFPPPSAMGVISANLYSTSGNARNAAASLQRILNTAPHAAETVSENDLDFAYWINSMARYGVDSQEAIDEWRDGIADLNYEDREKARLIIAEQDLNKLLKKSVDEDPELNKWFARSPEVPTQFYVEYKELMEHYTALYDGQVSLASGRALQVLRSQWGAFDPEGWVGKPTLMKHPPSVEAANQAGKPEAEIQSWTDKDFIESMDDLGVDHEDTMIMYAGKDEDGHPQYVIYNEDTGMRVDDNGQPFVWVPIWEESSTYRDVQRKVDREIAQARINASLPPSPYRDGPYKGFRQTWRDRGKGIAEELGDQWEGMGEISRLLIDSTFGPDELKYGTVEAYDEAKEEEAMEVEQRARTAAYHMQQQREDWITKYGSENAILPQWMRDERGAQWRNYVSAD